MPSKKKSKAFPATVTPCSHEIVRLLIEIVAKNSPLTGVEHYGRIAHVADSVCQHGVLDSAAMTRSRKLNPDQSASLTTICPMCGFTITPDLAKRLDSNLMECPKCGEVFHPVTKG
jgi:predicted RNA-binding Zn-ribbon protein involved in translation (DUF1610 family)